MRELTIPGKAYDIGKKLIGRKGDARNHSQCLEEAVYEVRKEVKSGKVRKSSTRRELLGQEGKTDNNFRSKVIILLSKITIMEMGHLK